MTWSYFQRHIELLITPPYWLYQSTGTVGSRTHTSAKIVNKESRFHKSAGLEELEEAGRGSPVHTGGLSESPTSQGNIITVGFRINPEVAICYASHDELFSLEFSYQSSCFLINSFTNWYDTPYRLHGTDIQELQKIPW